MADGLSGGVQQWIIGVASALSHLDGDGEEYLFLVSDGHASWLLPYLGGPCRVFQWARQVRRQPAANSAIPARPRRPPVALLAALASRRARRLVLAAAVADAAVAWWPHRAAVGPLRFAAARRLEDLAYGAGLWAGALRAREPRALLPAVPPRF